ncbi:MAG TPA: hydantoinase/oxoprolinase family protein [Candidatus Sulfomarinibacteraceae bacterium]|nr:hydantoinase/oxoprolinase family protein [Candidatus Sulfomarinibacteraceae bacterium]
MRLLGVDIGGTFTDLILADLDNGQMVIHKVPTTVEDPSVGMMAGIEQLCDLAGVSVEEIGYLMHGTTVATNALLTYEGARTGMITTEGYRDIVHIARHQRPQHYSIMQEIPWQDRPLVKRRHRKVVRERIGPRGEQIQELDEEQAKAAVMQLRDEGVESIAVCFLFSYVNPEHEERVKEMVEEIYPEAFVTTSSSIFPQFREFERFTTASINAFVGPKVKDYVNKLASRLEESGVGSELHIMRSNGGVATTKTAAEKPATLLLSGPAAGVLGGEWAAHLEERNYIITFDVGGTSADIGIVTPRGISEASARDTWIAGYPVMVPILDAHTIGAGGGSIAYVDAGDAFRVGPRSAGASPGPVCYGLGGSEPTVTDANVVLGRLDSAYFLGGEMTIYPEKAREAIQALADRLGLDLYETAEGVLTVLNNNMANAIRSRTVQKGYDPRDFTLVAFGGAGPLHAAEVAQSMGIPEVLVPLYPGIHSAMGLLTTDLRYDEIRNQFMLNTDMDLARLNTELQALEEEVRAQLREDGVPDSQIVIERSADCRYVGQGYELRATIPDGEVTEENVSQIWDNFHEIHEEEYGHYFAENPIELVSLRLVGVGRMPKLSAGNIEDGGVDGSEAYVKSAQGYFRVNGALEPFETRFYERHGLKAGSLIAGPAILYQKDTTTVVPPNWTARVQASGNLILKAQ